MLWLKKCPLIRTTSFGPDQTTSELPKENSKKQKIQTNKKEVQIKRLSTKNQSVEQKRHGDARTECHLHTAHSYRKTQKKDLHHHTTKLKKKKSKDKTKPATGPCSQTKAHVQIKHGKKGS